MQISTFDVTRCVKPSSHHGIWEEQAKEWEVFCYWRACFSKLQNTTYIEGIVLLIFLRDKVREDSVKQTLILIYEWTCNWFPEYAFYFPEFFYEQ